MNNLIDIRIGNDNTGEQKEIFDMNYNPKLLCFYVLTYEHNGEIKDRVLYEAYDCENDEWLALKKVKEDKELSDRIPVTVFLGYPILGGFGEEEETEIKYFKWLKRWDFGYYRSPEPTVVDSEMAEAKQVKIGREDFSE